MCRQNSQHIFYLPPKTSKYLLWGCARNTRDYWGCHQYRKLVTSQCPRGRLGSWRLAVTSRTVPAARQERHIRATAVPDVPRTLHAEATFIYDQVSGSY